jgi:hypothetical protein
VVPREGALQPQGVARGPRRYEETFRAAPQQTPKAVPQEIPPSRLPVSLVTLIASIGVLVAVVAFTAGRLGYSSPAWQNRTYWLGQALVLVPITFRLLSRRQVPSRETVTLVVVLTVAEYLLKVCYSPLGFAFNDEFLHWRGTTNVLATGNPFAINYGLPIGSHYPGLEEVTSALISCTGLSIFTAGLIVAGIAHLIYICTLYWAFCGFSRSHRIAGIAVLIYFGTPALTSFNSMFVYETLGLQFFALVILASLRAATEKSRTARNKWLVIAILGIFSTVVTHHVTSYLLTAVLILVTVASMIARSRRTGTVLGILAFISATSVVCWIIFVAPDTITYFRPTITGVVQGLNALQKGGSSNSPSTSAAPFGNQILEGIAILVISSLLIFDSRRVWRRYRNHPWIIAMTIGSLGWFIDLAVRVATPDGQELAGRTATFVYIPVSLVAALALSKLVGVRFLLRWEPIVITVMAAGAVTLLFDGLANGWPPYWERLPGPHLVSSFERSVGPLEIATSDWTLSALGPGNRMASDGGIYPVLIGYGGQDPLQDIGYLYTTQKFSPSIAAMASAQAVRYVVVDSRLSQSVPAAGSYFPGDSTVATKTIPLADLTKFNHISGVARVYDSGDIVIYNLQSLGYVPVP